MRTTGQRFLQISKAHDFVIHSHALDRLEQRGGFRPPLLEAYDLFQEARQVTYDELVEWGYRPAYRQRKQRGVQSWYFLLPFEDHELIAVIRKGESGGEFEWITTYAPNHSSWANYLFAHPEPVWIQ